MTLTMLRTQWIRTRNKYGYLFIVKSIIKSDYRIYDMIWYEIYIVWHEIMKIRWMNVRGKINIDDGQNMENGKIASIKRCTQTIYDLQMMKYDDRWWKIWIDESGKIQWPSLTKMAWVSLVNNFKTDQIVISG